MEGVLNMEAVKEELLQCSICMELFSDPRALPCQHTFCRDCLTTYIEGKTKSSSSKLNVFPCPLCRRKISLKKCNSNGDSFPINLMVNSLLDMNKSPPEHKGGKHKGKPTCDQKASKTSKIPRERKHKETQTEADRLSYKSSTDVKYRDNIFLPNLKGYQWDRVFNRRFENLIEKFIVRYIILTITTNVSGHGAVQRLKRFLAQMLCYICLIFYLILLLDTYYYNESFAKQKPVIYVILLYKLIHQALTINLRAYPIFTTNKVYFRHILFVHVIWFWITCLYLTLLLYTVFLIIALRGHPSYKSVCVEKGFMETCKSEVMDYPDISYLKRKVESDFIFYSNRIFKMDLSSLYILVSEFVRFGIKGEKVIITEDYDGVVRYFT